MVNQYGAGGTMSVTMDGPFGSFGSLVKVKEITLAADGWKNAASPYFQTVALDGVSINSKVDLQPDAAQISALKNAGTVLTAVNDSGTVNVYAVGKKPEGNITMQVTILEVVK